MDSTPRIALRIAWAGLALALGACSGESSLTTSTLLGGSGKAADPAPPAETAVDRALHVAATSARAQRCGYVFDPASVRQGYLAFEAQQGGVSPDQLAKAQQSYDFTLTKVTKAIASDEDYCSDQQTATIKRDLTQVLSGNYASSSKKPGANVGWWTPPKSAEPIDREKLFNPTH